PTGNESSSGLGLAIVKRIIELHKGKYGVISESSEEGSEFFFIIPKAQ
ncbi:MAG: sensor histidine kinase, partial [Chlorobi bacterium]|nr:sensor histidine kinase [Chlorobiota bacterium]